jgi:hypothetical protein
MWDLLVLLKHVSDLRNRRVSFISCVCNLASFMCSFALHSKFFSKMEFWPCELSCVSKDSFPGGWFRFRMHVSERPNTCTGKFTRPYMLLKPMVAVELRSICYEFC